MARVLRAVDRGRQQRAPLAAEIGELLVVDAAVQDVLTPPTRRLRKPPMKRSSVTLAKPP